MYRELPGAREQRQAKRFSVVLPVTFDSTTGWTRDVSGTGAYVMVSDRSVRTPDPGASIRLGLVLEHGDPGGRLDVRCQGTVMRVDHSTDALGVAVRFDSYHFDPEHIGVKLPRT